MTRLDNESEINSPRRRQQQALPAVSKSMATASTTSIASRTASTTSASTSTALGFLSDDQKVGLAVRTSMVSKPGAHYGRDALLPIPRKTQKDLLVIAVAQQQLRQTRERNRNNNEPVFTSPTELHSMDILQRRMYELKSDVDQEDEELAQLLKKTRARRYRNICLAATAIVLLVVVIGIVTGVTMNGKGVQDNAQNDSTSEEDLENRPSLLEIQNCSSSTLMLSERYKSFFSLVSSDPVIASAIATPFSSSNIALCWISQYDEFAMDPTTNELVPEIVERFALASMYYHYAGTNQTRLSPSVGLSEQNWLSDSHVCEWDFVECETNGVLNLVTALSFPMDSLTGQIPYELGLLQNLVQLDIAPSSMSGEIPSSLWNLTRLEHISLRFNEFGGTVMNGFTNLTQLKHLYLEHRLSGAIPHTTGLSKLTSLFFKNDFIGEPDPFPDLRSSTDLGE